MSSEGVGRRGSSYRTTVASRGGRFQVPLSAENRAAAGVAAGEQVDVEIQADTARPRSPCRPISPTHWRMTARRSTSSTRSPTRTATSGCAGSRRQRSPRPANRSLRRRGCRSRVGRRRSVSSHSRRTPASAGRSDSTTSPTRDAGTSLRPKRERRANAPRRLLSPDGASRVRPVSGTAERPPRRPVRPRDPSPMSPRSRSQPLQHTAELRAEPLCLLGSRELRGNRPPPSCPSASRCSRAGSI
jgi:hypothetical protein